MSRRIAPLLVFFALLWSGTNHAQDSATVRLGFLLNFARYVEWPDPALKPGAPLKICLAPGDGVMAGKLEELTRQVVQGHPVQAKQVLRPADVGDCQIVYLPAELPAQTMTIWLESTSLSHTLTISESPEFIESGGMIGLVAVGSRYRFDVNLSNVRRAELRMSSYLLKLARTVK
jgi:hypothetical protein